MTSLTLPAADGFPLAVHHFEPPPTSGPPKAICVIINATGVQARFYHDFASWLSRHSVATFTFDFRYSGASFPPDVLQQFKEASDEDERSDIFHRALLDCPRHWALMSHWTQQDLAAVVRYARSLHPNQPLTLLGNSLGGHLAALLDESVTFPKEDSIVRILNVCGGNAFWSNNKNPTAARYAFDELIAKPLETEGVFRASSLGLGYDLPYGVGQDWLRWYYHPLFSLQDPKDEANARRIGQRLNKYLYVGFEDDETISELMMKQMISLFSLEKHNFNSLWIDPAKVAQPRGGPWPKCGHVTSFAPSKKKNRSRAVEEEHQSSSGAEGYEAQEQQDSPPSGPTEAYQPSESSSASSASSKALTREETIFRLYLDYILHGNVLDAAQFGKAITHKRWTEKDERDGLALRRQEEQERSRARSVGKRAMGDYGEDAPSRAKL